MFYFALGMGIGLIVGWMVLPAPRFVTDFWIARGWAKPTAVPGIDTTHG